jgi:hypothetical protein
VTGAAWGTLIAALVLTVALWCVTIGGVLGGAHPASGTRGAVPTFSDTGATLRQSATTYLMSPTSGCLFVVGNDGRRVVMSAATGSVLTAGQTKNCDK